MAPELDCFVDPEGEVDAATPASCGRLHQPLLDLFLLAAVVALADRLVCMRRASLSCLPQACARGQGGLCQTRGSALGGVEARRRTPTPSPLPLPRRASADLEECDGRRAAHVAARIQHALQVIVHGCAIGRLACWRRRRRRPSALAQDPGPRVPAAFGQQLLQARDLALQGSQALLLLFPAAFGRWVEWRAEYLAGCSGMYAVGMPACWREYGWVGREPSAPSCSAHAREARLNFCCARRFFSRTAAPRLVPNDCGLCPESVPPSSSPLAVAVAASTAITCCSSGSPNTAMAGSDVASGGAVSGSATMCTLAGRPAAWVEGRRRRPGLARGAQAHRREAVARGGSKPRLIAPCHSPAASNAAPCPARGFLAAGSSPCTCRPCSSPALAAKAALRSA